MAIVWAPWLAQRCSSHLCPLQGHQVAFGDPGRIKPMNPASPAYTKESLGETGETGKHLYWGLSTTLRPFKSDPGVGPG